MTVYQGRLIVGGFFSRIGGVNAGNIAAWDGAKWEPIGPEVQGAARLPAVLALTVFKGHLIACADWNDLGSAVTQWDGVSWSALGALRSARCLGTVGDEALFAGGGPWQPGWGSEGVARWDGQDWQPLGAALNVRALVGHAQHLYAGGFFTMMGGRSSFGIGRWDGLLETHRERPATEITRGVPNPFHEAISLTIRAQQAGNIRVSVHDVQGREVVVIAEGAITAGEHPISWDGRGKQGRALSSGVYFVRLQSPGSDQRFKIVRLK